MASQGGFWSRPHMAFKSVSSYIVHFPPISWKLAAPNFFPFNGRCAKPRAKHARGFAPGGVRSPCEVWLKMKMIPVMSTWSPESLRHYVHNLGRGYKLTLSNAWSLSNFNSFSVTWRIRHFANHFLRIRPDRSIPSGRPVSLPLFFFFFKLNLIFDRFNLIPYHNIIFRNSRKKFGKLF